MPGEPQITMALLTDQAGFPLPARCFTTEIQVGAHTVTAADPVSDDLRQALKAITLASPANVAAIDHRATTSVSRTLCAGRPTQRGRDGGRVRAPVRRTAA
jgi:hypothetical protein